MTRDLISGQGELIIVLGDTIVDVDFEEFIKLPFSCLGTKRLPIRVNSAL